MVLKSCFQQLPPREEREEVKERNQDLRQAAPSRGPAGRESRGTGPGNVPITPSPMVLVLGAKLSCSHGPCVAGPVLRSRSWTTAAGTKVWASRGAQPPALRSRGRGVLGWQGRWPRLPADTGSVQREPATRWAPKGRNETSRALVPRPGGSCPLPQNCSLVRKERRRRNRDTKPKTHTCRQAL